MLLESDTAEFPERSVSKPIIVLKLTQAIFGHRPCTAVVLQRGYVVGVTDIQT